MTKHSNSNLLKFTLKIADAGYDLTCSTRYLHHILRLSIEKLICFSNIMTISLRIHAITAFTYIRNNDQCIVNLCDVLE